MAQYVKFIDLNKANNSVNDGIPHESYDNIPYKLHLPGPDNLVTEILKYGKGCLLYTRDLSRAYRQLRTDPLDWPLLGISWGGSWFIDTAIPFGARWGCMAMQRTTDSIVHMMRQEHRTLIGYIDDYVGIAVSHDKATLDYTRLHT